MITKILLNTITIVGIFVIELIGFFLIKNIIQIIKSDIELELEEIIGWIIVSILVILAPLIILASALGI